MVFAYKFVEKSIEDFCKINKSIDLCSPPEAGNYVRNKEMFPDCKNLHADSHIGILTSFQTIRLHSVRNTFLTTFYGVKEHASSITDRSQNVKISTSVYD